MKDEDSSIIRMIVKNQLAITQAMVSMDHFRLRESSGAFPLKTEVDDLGKLLHNIIDSAEVILKTLDRKNDGGV